MSVRNYINNARNAANQKYASWTGSPAPINGGTRYANMTAGAFDTAAGVGPNQHLSAAGTQASAAQSPYHSGTLGGAIRPGYLFGSPAQH